MAFNLSTTSNSRLNGVHPTLIKIVREAIQITTTDFSVGEGVRTLATQKKYVADGKSQTMASNHLVQKDGHGHAVDLWAFVDGKVDWDEVHYYPIMLAMVLSARKLGANIRLGGCWKWSDDIEPTLAGVKKAVADYVADRKRAKKKPFLDFVHFEI